MTILKALLILGNDTAWLLRGALGVDGGFVLEEIDQTNHFYCQLPH